MPLYKLIGWRTLVVIAIFILCEFFLSANQELQAPLLVENDGYVGWRPIPNQESRFGEKNISYKINSFGCRDREWTMPRDDDGVFRVVLLGNSLTFGTGVLIEETWGRQLEKRIKERDARLGIQREVVVMNSSSQGFVLEQMVRTYGRFARAFRPDLVLIGTVPHDIVPYYPTPAPLESPYRRTIALTALHRFLSEIALSLIHI